ncbi:RusA family crossover junction endodeoxyribonuclease [Pseudomonas sp.]|uniref:RusA family crossover junction endodeoxyribonuclease n=1 Tax=Pseudomonas sp. TaxID=306 RepID=UPI0025870D33|nr:RusA family crossover junction endodeoxyribonuclease [Pseudomonas sp.]
MTDTIKLELPWPPSVNRYYRTVLGRMLISKEGREYRKAIEQLVSVPVMFTGRVAVTVECHAPDRRRRDLDNLGKCLFDSLTHAGVWEDDSQIDDMRIVRAGVMPRGMVRVEIRGIA